MPDSLRTRIAAVIMRRWEYEPSCTCQDCSLEVADAVIRELGQNETPDRRAEGSVVTHLTMQSQDTTE